MKLVKLGLSIANTSESDLTVHIEPWGVQNVVPAGDSYAFYVEGPNESILHLEYSCDSLVVYPWDGSTIAAQSGTRLSLDTILDEEPNE